MAEIENTQDGARVIMSEDEYFVKAEDAAKRILRSFADDDDEKSRKLMAMLLVHIYFPAPPSKMGLGFEALSRKCQEMVMLEFGLTMMEPPKVEN